MVPLTKSFYLFFLTQLENVLQSYYLYLLFTPMKIKIFFTSILILFVVTPSFIHAKEWTVQAPEGFRQITWAKSRGITSFFKAQKKNGYLDFLTFIYLPYAQIRLISAEQPTESWGDARSPFDMTGVPTVKNWAFTKMVTEDAKTVHTDAKFFWNMPYFNVNGLVSDLSLSLKSTLGDNSYITSGSRPETDTVEMRRMLVVDNNKSSASITQFDVSSFLTNGDQAVEGFAPSVTIKADGAITSRLFVGVRAQGKELVIYCSRGATAEEASKTLLAAGVPEENQLQVDGGGSATCAYNMPGQYFVEPGRMLPHLMGAYPYLFRGSIIYDDVNLREGPSLKHKIIKKLKGGALVTAFEEKDNWVRIDQSQQWVYKPLIKIQ